LFSIISREQVLVTYLWSMYMIILVNSLGVIDLFEPRWYDIATSSFNVLEWEEGTYSTF